MSIDSFRIVLEFQFCKNRVAIKKQQNLRIIIQDNQVVLLEKCATVKIFVFFFHPLTRKERVHKKLSD